MRAIYKHRPLHLKYILALLCACAAYTAECQSIYDHSFRDIDNKHVHLKDFAGKKILFILLPVSDTESLALQLENFIATYGDKVQVIGILSQEDGYSPVRKVEVKTIYQRTGMVITGGMSSRKGTGQSPLMKWLTSKSENGHFDMAAKGPGQKFFVNEQGKLYAVLGHMPLSSPSINKIVNTTQGSQQAPPATGNLKP